jgi:hypothetical protein
MNSLKKENSMLKNVTRVGTTVCTIVLFVTTNMIHLTLPATTMAVNKEQLSQMGYGLGGQWL